MTLSNQSIINACSSLAHYLEQPATALNEVINKALQANPWFNEENIKRALHALASSLKVNKVEIWLSKYEFPRGRTQGLLCGLVLAGNIPAVGFQDVLAVIATSNIAVIKLSSQDNIIIPHLLEKLSEFEPGIRSHYSIVDRLQEFDAVIATGSNNSSRYFEYYFSKVPNVIRKNRNSVAVLNGHESKADLEALGNDIFQYFGLGCRNVSKLIVPEDYVFDPFFEAIENWNTLTNFHKYAHNYDYQLTLSMINRLSHYTNGFVVLVENPSMHSPIASLHYSRYQKMAEVDTELKANEAGIQCICAIEACGIPNSIRFGTTQSPELWDYADGVDVMRFLLDLQNPTQ